MKSLILSLFITQFIFCQDLTASAILDSMNRVMTPENVKSTIRQIITTSRGNEREFEYEMFSGSKGKNVLLRYTKPNVVKGNAILMKNHSDDIWIYFQRTRRVRKLASSSKNQKVEGSDFSYEDFSGGDTWKEDYDIKRLLDEDDKYILELIPKSDVSTSYGKMIVVIRKSDYYPDIIRYFDKNIVHEKTLTMEDIRNIEGYPTAMKMTMVNHLEDSETRMEIVNSTYNISYPDDYFTERYLRE